MLGIGGYDWVESDFALPSGLLEWDREIFADKFIDGIWRAAFFTEKRGKAANVSFGDRLTARGCLEDWLEGKQRISSATRLGYKQAVSEFLAYLGAEGEHRA